MSRREVFKLVHFGSTAWFILCVGYILILALRQAGFRWWVIFSLSGYSALFVFLLVSLYLFAIFRGIDRGQKIEAEHPLTSTSYYAVFYDVSPFLGALAGWIGIAGVSRVSELLLGIGLGTLATTFLVWIIIDPVTGLVERLLPASRGHRLERLAQARALRQKRQEAQKRLLSEIEAKEKQQQTGWSEVLHPYAEKLSDLVAGNKSRYEDGESEAVDIGVRAWQMGGLNCMQQLHSMTMEMCSQKIQDSMVVDYISSWWDGVGSWRNPSVG